MGFSDPKTLGAGTIMIGGTELRPFAVRRGRSIGPCALRDCSGTIVEYVLPIVPIVGEPYDHTVTTCDTACGCRAALADPETVRATAEAVGYSLEEHRFITTAA